MLFACDEYRFFVTYEMIKYVGVSVLGTPTTAWTLNPESSAFFFGTRLNLPLIAGLDWWFGD